MSNNTQATTPLSSWFLLRQARLPVIYVFGKKPLDIDHCVASFASAYDTYKTPSDAEVQADVILLTHDVSYTHLSGIFPFQLGLKDVNEVSEHLLRSIQDTFHSRQATISYHARQNISTSEAQSALLTDSKPSTIFYVGPDSLSLANLITTNFGCKVLQIYLQRDFNILMLCRSSPTIQLRRNLQLC